MVVAVLVALAVTLVMVLVALAVTLVVVAVLSMVLAVAFAMALAVVVVAVVAAVPVPVPVPVPMPVTAAIVAGAAAGAAAALRRGAEPSELTAVAVAAIDAATTIDAEGADPARRLRLRAASAQHHQRNQRSSRRYAKIPDPHVRRPNDWSEVRPSARLSFDRDAPAAQAHQRKDRARFDNLLIFRDKMNQGRICARLAPVRGVAGLRQQARSGMGRDRHDRGRPADPRRAAGRRGHAARTFHGVAAA
ncbi:MAG TPA: hypothetical protein VFV80_12545 [Geminicoccaceae bacterium]|nr:hypothetical protein [Geminicoccaceae bacterium]